MRISRFALAAIVISALSVIAGGTARAENYPSRPVKVVIGYSAGGAVDVHARLIGQKLSTELGQPFVIENRPGASATIAAQVVARSEPDGYTLFVTVPSVFTIVPYTMSKLAASAKDFVPVGEIADAPLVLLVNPSVPAKTFEELVALLRKPDSGLSYASPGTGTTPHLATELLLERIGGKALNVPYKGSNPALTDLIGGQVQFMFDNLSSALPAIQGGKLRPLAITSSKRFASLPDVPTIAESGVPNYEVTNWFAIYAPAGTPAEIVEKLRVQVDRATADSEVARRLIELGSVPSHAGSEQIAARISRESTQWQELIKTQGLKLGQ